MSEGRCLCGSVSWKVIDEPFSMYNCFCRMCQKFHGAAFGTYSFFKLDKFEWTCPDNSIAHYQSSKVLKRSFCSDCGSVVPNIAMSGDYWSVPAGSHNAMRKPDYNIFASDNSPWHSISGDMPRCDGYPEESGKPSVEGCPVPTKTDGPVKGSCLCGEVSYQITEPFKLARNCHCSRCRMGRSAAHASNGFVSYDGLEFLSGEDHLKAYKVPDAKFFTQVFCDICSSLVPRKDPERKISIIPMGSLDNDPEVKTVDHIFIDDKAGWHDITDNLPLFPQGPPA